MRRLLTIWGALALLAMSGAGCGMQQTAPPEPEPSGVLQAWHAALAEGRPDEAYALLGAELQKRYTLQSFRALYARQKDALIAQAKQLLAQAGKVQPEQRAEVAVGNSATARLVRTEAGWRLVAPVGEVAPSGGGGEKGKEELR